MCKYKLLCKASILFYIWRRKTWSGNFPHFFDGFPIEQIIVSRYVDTGEMQNDFPYRARAMFAFEEQDGVDVCFFGMHVQVTFLSPLLLT